MDAISTEIQIALPADPKLLTGFRKCLFFSLVFEMQHSAHVKSAIHLSDCSHKHLARTEQNLNDGRRSLLIYGLCHTMINCTAPQNSVCEFIMRGYNCFKIGTETEFQFLQEHMQPPLPKAHINDL